MASTATTRNRFNKQGTGDNTGTWGGVLNAQVFDILDEALDGVTTLTVSGNATLTSSNYVTDQARRRVLKLTGSPSASYIITVPSVEKFYFVINQSNAAQSIKTSGGVAYSVPAGEARAVACDGTDCFGPSAAVPYVIGAVIDYAGASAPSGWMVCAGQAVSRATYAALFGAIGTAHGAGNGSTTFNLPDLRGRVVAGIDNMGGGDASRLASSPLMGPRLVLGGVGGHDSHVLTTNEMPYHTHVQDPHTHTYTAAWENYTVNSGSATTVVRLAEARVSGSTAATNQYAGGGALHNNVQPTIVLNKIIYAGV